MFQKSAAEAKVRKRSFLLMTIFIAGGLFVGLSCRNTQAAPAADGPQFDKDGKLVRPEGYRRTWIFLSSGFGMSYNRGMNRNPQFTNVFVNPTAYDYFVANGKWPDKTMFVLEEYESTSHGSINKSGSYQEKLGGVVVEVKDVKRYAEKWAYFSFGTDKKTTGPIEPAKNACWNCHEDNAAVEHTFVQFYPEMLTIARAKGTIKPTVHLE
jgi:cytochrome P460